MIDLLGAAAVVGAYLVLRAAFIWLVVRALAEPMGDGPCDN